MTEIFGELENHENYFKWWYECRCEWVVHKYIFLFVQIYLLHVYLLFSNYSLRVEIIWVSNSPFSSLQIYVWYLSKMGETHTRYFIPYTWYGSICNMCHPLPVQCLK